MERRLTLSQDTLVVTGQGKVVKVVKETVEGPGPGPHLLHPRGGGAAGGAEGGAGACRHHRGQARG